MTDFLAITGDSIPKRMHGSDSGYSLRLISQHEALSVEDQFFAQGEERKVARVSKTIVLPNITKNPTTLEDYATLAEFSLCVLTVSGHPTFAFAALFSDGKCIHAQRLPRYQNQPAAPKFALSLNGVATSQWLRRCANAQKNLADRMHITAGRYVRYSRSDNLTDAVMDLCISLESLLDSQTEVSFRFSACLTRITGEKGQKAEEMAALLSQLYSVRSKLSHGDPAAAKLLRKLEPNFPTIRKIARRILTTYLLFMSEHSREEWKSHVNASLYS